MSRGPLDRRLVRIAVLLAATLAPLTVRAADTEADADEDLLEFLGTVGEDDATWTDYLEKTDIEKASKLKPQRPSQPAPAPAEVKKT
ncbi:MAG: hypothetical protein WCE48_00260 [Steroidobacteraceae bacterium]